MPTVLAINFKLCYVAASTTDCPYLSNQVATFATFGVKGIACPATRQAV